MARNSAGPEKRRIDLPKNAPLGYSGVSTGGQDLTRQHRLDTSNNHDFWRGLIAFFAMRAAV